MIYISLSFGASRCKTRFEQAAGSSGRLWCGSNERPIAQISGGYCRGIDLCKPAGVNLCEPARANLTAWSQRQHTGRWKIEYQGVVYITDQRQKKVITTYKTNQADSSSDSSSSAPRGYELDLGQLLRDKL